MGCREIKREYFKTKFKPLLFLLLIPPVPGEVVSGSTPVTNLANPLSVVTLILLYGCGTLIIRELDTYADALSCKHKHGNPILISDLTWPSYRNQPLTGKRGFLLAAIGLLAILGLFHPDAGSKHLIAFVFGSIFYLVLVSPILQYMQQIHINECL